MIPTQIENHITRIDTPAVYAYYIVNSSELYPLALVCDDNDVLIGVIGKSDLKQRTSGDISKKTCGQICNRNFFSLQGTEDELYVKARNIFAEKYVGDVLPVVSENGVPIRLFGKFQAFFRDMCNMQIPYYSYASGLIDAVGLALSRGYKHISAIEFGVAGGYGLIHLGIYAREIQRLYGVKIDVYGFDSGKGLFAPVDYRDCPQHWIEGDYQMDIEALQSKLYQETLIIGDICETTKSFLDEYKPAPIGFISIDVDFYTPTVAILEMLLGSDDYFLPTITMYFDDIIDKLEFQGETLAIREFNAKNEHIKISPVHTAFDQVKTYMYTEKSKEWLIQHPVSRIKWCNRFNHPRFSSLRTSTHHFPI